MMAGSDNEGGFVYYPLNHDKLPGVFKTIVRPYAQFEGNIKSNSFTNEANFKIMSVDEETNFVSAIMTICTWGGDRYLDEGTHEFFLCGEFIGPSFPFLKYSWGSNRTIDLNCWDTFKTLKGQQRSLEKPNYNYDSLKKRKETFLRLHSKYINKGLGHEKNPGIVRFMEGHFYVMIDGLDEIAHGVIGSRKNAERNERVEFVGNYNGDEANGIFQFR